MNSTGDILTMIVAGIVWVLLWVVPQCALLALGYYLFSLPLRRRERARFFLDLLETGLKDGRRIEDTLVSISGSGDPGLSSEFRQLAAFLSKGLTLRQGLDVCPRFLPPQILAMLRAGLDIGDLGRVLPACRQFLRDGLSQTRSATNYLMVLAYIVTPLTFGAFIATKVFVLPKFMDVALYMGGEIPLSLRLLNDFGWLFIFLELFLVNVVWIGALIYVCGPSWRRWTDPALGPIRHRMAYWLPWRRKRLQRDFSTLLAVLLDAGMPEPEALKLAADCTANTVFSHRANLAHEGLKKGLKLTEAVARVDDSGEFKWRLTQALQSGKGFMQALAGWIESLDARAFQQEQAAAQTISTGLVLLHGLLIGTLVIGVFAMLISIVNQQALW